MLIARALDAFRCGVTRKETELTIGIRAAIDTGMLGIANAEGAVSVAQAIDLDAFALGRATVFVERMKAFRIGRARGTSIRRHRATER